MPGTRSALIGVVLLALGACGTPAPRPPETPEAAACREETRNAPELREVFRRSSQLDPWRTEMELRQTREGLIRACLQRQGIVTYGVQPPTRR
jgi:hypothetical protein